MTHEEYQMRCAEEESRYDAALEKARPKAIALQHALSRINEGSIQVVCREHIPQKQKALLARELLKSLGLKGIRVKCARGANCHWVHVCFPPLRHTRNSYGCSKPCEACVYRERVSLAIEEILLRAFPLLVDESDSQRDYFNPPWIIKESDL
jgi:hypothetical protein